jgi:hypothetical protein
LLVVTPCVFGEGAREPYHLKRGGNLFFLHREREREREEGGERERERD